MMKLRIDPDLPDDFKSLRVVSIRCMISYKFSWSWIWSIIKIDHSSIQKKLLFWSLQFPHRGNQPSEHIIFWKAMERWPGWLWKQGLNQAVVGALQQVVQQQQRNVQKSNKTKLQQSSSLIKQVPFLIVHAASKSMQLWIFISYLSPFFTKKCQT